MTSPGRANSSNESKRLILRTDSSPTCGTACRPNAAASKRARPLPDYPGVSHRNGTADRPSRLQEYRKRKVSFSVQRSSAHSGPPQQTQNPITDGSKHTHCGEACEYHANGLNERNC